MWVTKLLISPVKKRIFCPKLTKFGPKLAFLVNLGQAMQAYSVPCWWVGWWLWRAGCISQHTYLLYGNKVRLLNDLKTSPLVIILPFSINNMLLPKCIYVVRRATPNGTNKQVEEPVPSPMYIGRYAIRPDQTTLSRDQIFNQRRRCQKIYMRAISALWDHVEENSSFSDVYRHICHTNYQGTRTDYQETSFSIRGGGARKFTLVL